MNQNKTNYSPAHVLVRDHLLSVVSPYTIFHILWFHYLETIVTGNYLVMHTRPDELILFLPVFIIPYLLRFVYIFVTLLYFSRTGKGEAVDLCLLLSLGMTTALFICTTFPSDTDLRVSVDPANNFFTSLVRTIQSTDTPTNVLPNIHVFNALAVHVMVTRSRSLAYRPLVRRASLTLMLLICLSTVLLKQHSALNVFGAPLLGYFVNAIVYGSHKVPALALVGADALFQRKRNPVEAYQQLRKK